MIYEIINPSDPYTLEAEDDTLAAVACLVLSNGFYFLRREDGVDVDMPSAFTQDIQEDIRQRLGINLDDYLQENLSRVAACLRSVTLGTTKDRQSYQLGLSLITDDDGRRKWRDDWDDKRRSSMNNIWARALKMAEAIEAKAAQEEMQDEC